MVVFIVKFVFRNLFSEKTRVTMKIGMEPVYRGDRKVKV